MLDIWIGVTFREEWEGKDWEGAKKKTKSASKALVISHFFTMSSGF